MSHESQSQIDANSCFCHLQACQHSSYLFSVLIRPHERHLSRCGGSLVCRLESLVEENARLRQEVAELKSVNERLERRIQELERQVEGLLRSLEEARRAGKRQAAPFSRQEPKAHPAKPGRKAGARVWLP